MTKNIEDSKLDPKDVLPAMQLLLSAGYRHAPQLRTHGSPFCLLSPDGIVVWEGEFLKELEKE